MTNTDLLTGQIIGAPSGTPSVTDAAIVPPSPEAATSGRPRGRPPKQTRGRPANRTQRVRMPAERTAETYTDQAIEPDTMEDYEALAGTLTRQSRQNGNNTFDIPQAGRIPGWDYQFVATHIMGAEVDASEQTNWQAGGWIPARPEMFPTLCPAGWTRKTIDRQGMRLMMRPMRLTHEAVAEQNAQAFERKQAALARAAAGDAGREYAPRRNEGLSVQVKPLLE